MSKNELLKNVQGSCKVRCKICMKETTKKLEQEPFLDRVP